MAERPQCASAPCYQYPRVVVWTERFEYYTHRFLPFAYESREFFEEMTQLAGDAIANISMYVPVANTDSMIRYTIFPSRIRDHRNRSLSETKTQYNRLSLQNPALTYLRAAHMVEAMGGLSADRRQRVVTFAEDVLSTSFARVNFLQRYRSIDAQLIPPHYRSGCEALRDAWAIREQPGLATNNSRERLEPQADMFFRVAKLGDSRFPVSRGSRSSPSTERLDLGRSQCNALHREASNRHLQHAQ